MGEGVAPERPSSAGDADGEQKLLHTAVQSRLCRNPVNGMRKSGERYRRRHQRNVGRVLSSHKGSLREIHQADVARRGRANAGPPSRSRHTPGGQKSGSGRFPSAGPLGHLYLGRTFKGTISPKREFMLKLLWKPISYLSNV